MTNEQPRSDQEGANQNPNQLNPNQLAGPEMADAAAQVGGIGSTAMSAEVAPLDDKPRFLARRWAGLKQNMREAFDLRTYDAGQAIAEAGVPFSKWDAIKAALHETVNVSKAIITGKAKDEYAVSRINSSVHNPVVRKKMAQAMAAGNGAPITQHLRKNNMYPLYDPRNLLHEVGKEANKIRERNHDKLARSAK